MENIQKNIFLSDRNIKILSISLFILIAILSLYIFNIISLPQFLSQESTKATPSQNTSKSNDYGNFKSLIFPSSPKTYSNDSTKWNSSPIPNAPNSKIKVVSGIRINANMSISFSDDAPKNSNTGILFDNGLKDDDPNLRRMYFFYFLENKLWIVKYQAGKNIKYYGLLQTIPENGTVFGTFSLALPPDGKSIKVSFPNQTSKTISFPGSLYDVSNQMSLKTQIGPKSSITFSSLNYEIITK